MSPQHPSAAPAARAPIPSRAAARPTLARHCDDCGLAVRLPPLAAGVDSRCPRCDAVLRKHPAVPLSVPLALAAAALILCVTALATPFLSLSLLGQVRESHVGSGTWAFADGGLWMVGALVALTVVLVPLARLSARLAVLGALVLGRPWPGLVTVMRWHERLGAWTMLEVFLFGALISYTRLVDLAQVELGPAVWALAATVVVMVAAGAAFEPQAAWDALERAGVTRVGARGAGTTGAGAAGVGRLVTGGAAAAGAGPGPAAPGPAAPATAAAGRAAIGCHCCRRVTRAVPGSACPRCESVLHRRKPGSVARSWALVAAAVILYVPANAYPVMDVITFGRGGPHTILGGAVEFVHAGYWPLALIIFVASVVVPMLKLVGLVVMLLGIHRHSDRHLVARTRLYRVVEAIGRWSMIDVFVVSVLVSLVRFGPLAGIDAGIGVACFGGVVVLTMLAAESFDPRLMWDAAEPAPAGARR